MKRIISILMMVTMVMGALPAFAEYEGVPGDPMWVTADVNIRSAPRTSAPIVGVIPKGELVMAYDFVTNKQGQLWAYVEYSTYYNMKGSGYVSCDYLEFANICDDIESYYTVQMVVTGDANIRAGKSTSSEVLGVAYKGTVVEVTMLYPTEDGRVWAEVEWNEWQNGYISTANLKFVLTKFPELGRLMRVNTHSVNVRESANIDSKVLDYLSEGQVVRVKYYIPVFDTEDRIWAYCTYRNKAGNEKEGYVSVKFLRKYE